jgi:glycosyltransferase involved in cell wall biosynthesis
MFAHKKLSDMAPYACSTKAVPSDMRLEIIGRPTDTRYFEDLRALAEGKQVVFRTGCSDERMIEAYRRATCVVLPSVYQTMYGDKTSVPEVVQDRVTGFVVPPNRPDLLREKLLWLRDHAAESSAMGLAARQHVLEKFTWPAVVRRCLDIYNAKS